MLWTPPSKAAIFFDDLIYVAWELVGIPGDGQQLVLRDWQPQLEEIALLTSLRVSHTCFLSTCKTVPFPRSLASIFVALVTSDKKCCLNSLRATMHSQPCCSEKAWRSKEERRILVSDYCERVVIQQTSCGLATLNQQIPEVGVMPGRGGIWESGSQL